jgi:hypothetical protein
MQFIEFIGTRHDNGAALPFGKATVVLKGTATLATLYNASGSPLGVNPVSGDANGVIGFAAANGAYDVTLSSSDGGYVGPTVHDLQLYDLTQLDSQVTAAQAAAGLISANITAINAVASNAANISTVAGISSSVTTVAGDHANIVAVAGDLANINAVATNLPAVNAVVAAAATLGVYPNAAGVGGNIPQGALSITVSGGTGGTNATGKVATYSGGTLTNNPVITYDVVGGVVVNVVMKFPGLYIGAGTPTMPTVVLPGIGSGTGTISLTGGLLYAVGQTYWAVSADGRTLDSIVNTAGAPASNSANVPSLYLKGGVDSAIATAGIVLPSLPAPAEVFASFSQQLYYDLGATTTTFATWLSGLSGTFTRSGPCTYINAAGLRVAGTTDTPRFTYSPVTLQPTGLRYEAAATQMLTNTDNLAHANWAFASAETIRTASAVTGPDGTTSAGTAIESTNNSNHRLWYDITGVTTTTGHFYAFQTWVKANGRTKFNMFPDAGLGMGASVLVDLTAGTIGGTGWHIEALPSGWYRIWTTGTATATGTTHCNFTYALMDGLGNLVYTGDGVSGIAVGGIQLEEVATATTGPTSYIPRTTAAAVRGADTLTITLPAGVSKMTYTLGDGSFAPVASVSPGSYVVPVQSQNTIQQMISVDLAVVGSPVTSVAGKTGAVTLAQADVGGLTTTSSPTFASLVTTADTQTLGPAIFKNVLATVTLQWTLNRAALTTRAVAIGNAAGNAATGNWQNTTIVGHDAGKAAATLGTTVLVGDTAGGSCTSISGANLIGNEAGNSSSSISGSNIIGNGVNLGKTAGGGSVATVNADIVGQMAARFNSVTNSVIIGQAAGGGTITTAGVIDKSVLIGSQTGSSLAGATCTSNVMIGYNIQAPTATTSNYLNIANVLLGSMAGTVPVFTLQKPDGSAAALAVSQIMPGAGAVIWTSGAGSPETVVTAPVGSLFTRTDGGAGTTLYVKESGSGNTGWIGK